MRKDLAVFFGGESAEHDVSVITGMQTIAAADKKKYRILPIYVDKLGRAYLNFGLKSAESVKNYQPKSKEQLKFVVGDGIYLNKTRLNLISAVLCFHGGLGENGGYSALMELCKVPYTAANGLGGNIGMNKRVQKILAEKADAEIIEYSFLKSGEKPKDVKYPVVVKPNSCGSSIGVTTAENEEQLLKALNVAFTFDTEVLIERKAQNFYELNAAAIKYGDSVYVSEIEMPNAKNGILTFEDKYINKGKLAKGKISSKGMETLDREIPAKIDKELENKIIETTKTLYSALNLFGVVRFDYIVENEILYFNEVNTIPGSMSYYLWTGKNIDFKDLIDMLVFESVERFKQNKRTVKRIDTGII